jgi:hypothetical protein
VATLEWNRWQVCAGISGKENPEWVAEFTGLSNHGITVKIMLNSLENIRICGSATLRL